MHMALQSDSEDLLRVDKPLSKPTHMYPGPVSNGKDE